MVVGGVVSGRRPCRHERAVVLGAVKAKPCGWPLEERPALTAPVRAGLRIERAGAKEGLSGRPSKGRDRKRREAAGIEFPIPVPACCRDARNGNRERRRPARRRDKVLEMTGAAQGRPAGR
jgi:hypothetical protein